MGWPLTSPAMEPSRFVNFGSTAPNTSTNSKYGHTATHDGYSDAKSILESPFIIRKFMEQELLQNQMSAYAS